MSSINQVILCGHVQEVPGLRSLKTGGTVANFFIRTEFDGKPEWHRIAAFEQLAQFAAEKIIKGLEVRIEGRIHTRSYTNSKGGKGYSTEVVADSILIDSSMGESEENKADYVH